MAPKQNTFTLVPNPLGMQGLMSRPANASGPQSRPPMTSKQAQKLYKEANRQPRMSKAEQRRLERQEQERIRQELDKEKQAAKARTLREKKKAKEQLVLQEKKRKGLPLVKVRPSQDTIARFVRGNGMGKKRDSAGAAVALPVVTEEAEDDRSSTEDGLDETTPLKEETSSSQCKRQRLDQHCSHEGNSESGIREEDERVEIAANAVKAAQDPLTLTPSPGERNTTTEPEVGEDTKPITTACEEASLANENREPIYTTAVVEDSLGIKSGRPFSMSVVADDSLGKGENATTTIPKSPLGKKNREHSITTPMPLVKQLHAIPSANVVHSGPPKVMDDTLPQVTLTKPLAIQQGTLEGRSGSEKATSGSANPKPLATGPLKLHMTNKTPVAPRPQTPGPQPQPRKQAPMPPPQRHPSPHALPAKQQHTARKPSQETTNSSNRTRPGLAVDNVSKYSSPYKAALPVPRVSHPSPTVVFKESNPRALARGVQKPKFLLPHLRSRESGPTPASKEQNRRPQEDAVPLPPTSTQLFIMSHIDDVDVFPTPSQEARELQTGPPAFMTKQPKAAPLRPPLAGFAEKPASRPRHLTRQVVHANISMAPPPRPAAVKVAEVPILPFISTQDLAFSSQDLRELETMTPGKAKGSGFRPPFLDKRHGKVRQQPSTSSYSSTKAAAQAVGPGFQAKHPPLPSKQPAPARKTTPPKQGPEDGACPPKHDSVPKNQQTPQSDSRTATCSTSSVNLPETPCPPEAATRRAPSPEKRRFFSSSGHGMELLAIDRSRKTHQEEERRRQAERQAQSRLGGNTTEGFEQEQPPSSRRREEQFQSLRPQQTLPQLGAGHPKALSQQKRGPGSQPTPPVPTTSQKTDYGDDELDAIDFIELGLDY